MLAKGNNIGIRLIRSQDIETLLGLWENLESRGEYFPHTVFTENTLRQRFQADGFYSEQGGQCLICRLSDQAIVGNVFFFRPNVFYQYLEIGYILFDPAARGKGYCSEAVSLLSGHLFKTRQINKLLLSIHPDNAASRRVAEKCGYTLEGVDRQAAYSDGAFMDLERYSLLRGERSAS